MSLVYCTREQFEKETLLRDEHEELRKYIDQGLRRDCSGGTSNEEQKKTSIDILIGYPAIYCYTVEETYLMTVTQDTDVLLRAASKLKGYRSEASNELLSEHMLAGIPEVDLGISARISNILETEKKKSELLEQAMEKARRAALCPQKTVDEEPVLKRFAL
ncbi:hepatocellular carcinoma-associated antigen 59 [Dictyocaulus viviparus]|uniref:Hepatocellular carcinoma-associated antigen 59 n=1 Tax=Dictyocaulus viviparus TaxID=29172 RepID=A0A0D8XLL3_DICVI|nr:hepatocellular carcinoma-associated antigen 59 [Dictyocaulus viviparus]